MPNVRPTVSSPTTYDLSAPADVVGAAAPRYVVLAEGSFGPMSSKTANACIRYTPERVVAVVDSTRAGATAEEVLGFGGAIPVVATMRDAMAFAPTAVLVGIAPAGGRLPESWTAVIAEAMRAGLDVWSGLHTFLGDDPMLAEVSARTGARIVDLRRPPADLDVA